MANLIGRAGQTMGDYQRRIRIVIRESGQNFGYSAVAVDSSTGVELAESSCVAFPSAAATQIEDLILREKLSWIVV